MSNAGLTEQLATLQEEVTQKKVSIKTAQRNIEKLDKKQQKDDEERAGNSKSIEDIQKELSAMEKDAQNVINSYNNAKSVLGEKADELKEIKAQHEQIKAKASELGFYLTLGCDALQVAQLQSTEVDVDNQLEEHERALQDIQAKFKHWAKKLEGLQLHKVGHGLAAI